MTSEQQPVSSAAPQQGLIIWKAAWLPGSETFVRNQVDNLERWSATCVGAKRVSSPLGRSADVILYGDSLIEKVRRATFVRRGRSRRVVEYFRESSPQLLHTHFASDATLSTATARELDLPHVITAHGTDVLSPTAHATYIRKQIRSTLADATLVLAVSSYLAAGLRGMGIDQSKIVVHHTGIPLGQRPGSDAEPFWDAVFVGRLVAQKGVLDALQAVSEAQRQAGRTLRFCIIGDGPLREEVQTQARALGVTVELLGHVSPDRVARELERARMLLAPSKTSNAGAAEAFGMVYLEAAARAIPAVAYRSGGVSEAVAHGQTGLLSDEGDVRSLAASVLSLLRNSSMAKELGCAGRERAESAFDIGTQTRLLESIYDQVSNV